MKKSVNQLARSSQGNQDSFIETIRSSQNVEKNFNFQGAKADPKDQRRQSTDKKSYKSTPIKMNPQHKRKHVRNFQAIKHLNLEPR